MQLVRHRSLSFAGFTLDLKRGCLRQDGREIKLRPKSFHLLHYLAENAGRLISKDDIIGAVWPNVAVADESLARCVSDVRVALGDGDQRIIKTVPKRGYLFAAPVSPAADLSPPSADEFTATIHEPAAAPRLSIVVLPFANLGGDGAQDYFVDAITESLTTDLSRIQGSFVIARNTAFTYRGRAVDIRQIGRELGVRYVMEGSVQSGAARVRVNAQLVDAATGAHLWAERFDKPRADALDMQDEITAQLARVVGIELVAAEGRRAEREHSKNMDAVDLTMRGWAMWNQRRTVARKRESRSLFEAALQLDEGNVDALIGFAETLTYDATNYLLDDPSEPIATASAAVAKALMLAPNNALAHYGRGRVLEVSRAPDAALREYGLAVTLDRNLAAAHARAGLVQVYVGRPEETEAHIAEAIRLSPRDPVLLDLWYWFLGVADLNLGRPDRAVDRLRRALDINPNLEICYFWLAAAQVLIGRTSEAAELCVLGRRLAPTFTLSRYRRQPRSDNPIFLANRERVIEAMRKAGIPE